MAIPPPPFSGGVQPQRVEANLWGAQQSPYDTDHLRRRVNATSYDSVEDPPEYGHPSLQQQSHPYPGWGYQQSAPPIVAQPPFQEEFVQNSAPSAPETAAIPTIQHPTRASVPDVPPPPLSLAGLTETRVKQNGIARRSIERARIVMRSVGILVGIVSFVAQSGLWNGFNMIDVLVTRFTISLVISVIIAVTPEWFCAEPDSDEIEVVVVADPTLSNKTTHESKSPAPEILPHPGNPLPHIATMVLLLAAAVMSILYATQHTHNIDMSVLRVTNCNPMLATHGAGYRAFRSHIDSFRTFLFASNRTVFGEHVDDLGDTPLRPCVLAIDMSRAGSKRASDIVYMVNPEWEAEGDPNDTSEGRYRISLWPQTSQSPRTFIGPRIMKVRYQQSPDSSTRVSETYEDAMALWMAISIEGLNNGVESVIKTFDKASRV